MANSRSFLKYIWISNFEISKHDVIVLAILSCFFDFKFLDIIKKLNMEKI